MNHSSITNQNHEKNDFINNNVLDYVIIFYVVFITYCSSLLNTVHFIFYQKYSGIHLIICWFLFFLFSLIALVKPSVGQNFINMIVNEKTINLAGKFNIKLQAIVKKNTYLCCIFVYLYLLLLLVHWFCRVTMSVDIYIEYGYIVFNLLRLYLYPFFILLFVLNNMKEVLPKEIYLMANVQELLQFAKEALHTGSEFYQKNPKTAKGLGVCVAVVGGVAFNGADASRHVKKCLDSPHMAGVRDLERPFDPSLQAQSLELKRSFGDIYWQAEKNPVSVGLYNFSQFVKGKDMLPEELRKVSAKTDSLVWKQKEIDLWKQKEIDQSLMGTPASNALLATKKGTILEPVDPKAVVNIAQPEINTVLESKLSYLEYFFF